MSRTERLGAVIRELLSRSFGPEIFGPGLLPCGSSPASLWISLRPLRFSEAAFFRRPGVAVVSTKKGWVVPWSRVVGPVLP
jgi:hypothetical protein